MGSLGNWSQWKQFPDPRKGDLLCAPLGPGCYEQRLGEQKGHQKVLFGHDKCVAQRMTSLLPSADGGSGTRNNEEKRNCVWSHIDEIEYRTIAFGSVDEAKKCENELKKCRDEYCFKT